jgi:hypothetical protein
VVLGHDGHLNLFWFVCFPADAVRFGVRLMEAEILLVVDLGFDLAVAQFILEQLLDVVLLEGLEVGLPRIAVFCVGERVLLKSPALVWSPKELSCVWLEGRELEPFWYFW